MRVCYYENTFELGAAVADIKQNILIVEDDVDVAEMLDAYFRVQGYAVTTVNWGLDAVKVCRQKRPDLVILDIRLPDIDGFEVARRLREARRTENIPIVFLTEKRGRTDILQGLEMGADDYITKPFDIQELRLRVRNALVRTTQGAINNPVTNLPEGSLVDERLSECLLQNDWAILVVSLEHMDDFREAYGFVASDDVLRAVSLMVHNAVRSEGNPTDFVGHLGANEFVLLTQPDSLEVLKERIDKRLEQSLEYFYPLEDRTERANQHENRLSINLWAFSPGKKSYKNLEALKNALLRHKPGTV
ncbi:MAG: response regulator [Anaerolineales bacterium]|nr:response regulator [Anaerolineales bacterium]